LEGKFYLQNFSAKISGLLKDLQRFLANIKGIESKNFGKPSNTSPKKHCKNNFPSNRKLKQVWRKIIGQLFEEILPTSKIF